MFGKVTQFLACICLVTNARKEKVGEDMMFGGVTQLLGIPFRLCIGIVAGKHSLSKFHPFSGPF